MVTPGNTKVKASFFSYGLYIQKSYSCFASPLLAFRYYKTVQGISVQKVCSVEDFYENAYGLSLDEFSESKAFDFASQLITGLASLHKDYRIHGNVRPTTILYRNRDSSHLDVMWTDLGFSRKVETEKLAYPLSSGFYGDPSATAPEMIGKTCESGTYVLQAECWAFGCCLYDLLHNETLPWKTTVISYFKGHKFLSDEKKKALRTEMEKFLDEEKKRIELMPASLKKELFKICMDFLIIDPSKRPTMKEMSKHLAERKMINDGFTPPNTSFLALDEPPPSSRLPVFQAIPEAVEDELSNELMGFHITNNPSST